MKPILSPVQKSKALPLGTDLSKLMALVRERQSSLIMLLQEKRQRIWDRPQWLLKESEYQEKDNYLSREIRRIIMNWVLLQDQPCNMDHQSKSISNFWLKIKIVMKMSLERMKILNLLNESLFQRYEAIIDEINRGYDKNSGILHYRTIQDMIKGRNRLIHDILSQKNNILGPAIERNLSEYHINYLKKQAQSPLKNSKMLSLTKRRELTTDFKALKRPLSQQNRRKKIVPSAELLRPKKLRKVNFTLDILQDKLYDIMEMKIDAAIDRKKTLQANLEMLQIDLIDKNSNNQKAITNFILTHSGKKITNMKPKRLLKMNNKVKEDSERSPLVKKKAKDLNSIRNRGLSMGKLKKMINKIGNKCLMRPSTCFSRQKKIL